MIDVLVVLGIEQQLTRGAIVDTTYHDDELVSLGVCVGRPRVAEAVQSEAAQQRQITALHLAGVLAPAPKNIWNFLLGYCDRLATYIHLILVGLRRRSSRRLS